MNYSQKRILSILMVAAMACGTLPQNVPFSLTQPVMAASAASVLESLTWDETEDETGIIITGYNGEDTSLVIPGQIDNLPVTVIGSQAFLRKNTLVNVELPDTVEKIESMAFSQCENLRTINMPQSLQTIGDSAFGSCSVLEAINLPEGVTSIGNGTFSTCTQLATITIPESVTSIGEAAFRDTEWLKNMRQVNPLVVVNHILIDGATCSGNVVFPEDVTVTSINDQAFSGNRTMTGITIPDTVTYIGNQAFAMCSALTSITIPESVISTGTSVFYNCAGLTEATLPDSMTELNTGLFSQCSALRTVKLPARVTSISDGLFDNCTSLSEIQIPNTVRSIGMRSFASCTSLTDVVIPEGVQTIAYWGFVACSNLERVTIPDSMTNISGQAFMACNKLIICAHTGTYGESYATSYGKTFEAIETKFSNVSLSLTDDLALNFFAAGVNADNKDDYKVVFTGKCEEKGKDTAFKEQAGLYCASANVSADHMNETITAKLYKKVGDEWTEIDSCTYSVNQYLENAMPEADWSDAKTEAFENLIETVKLYGEVSYAYFNTPDNMPMVTSHFNEINQMGDDYLKCDEMTFEDNYDTMYTDKFSLVLNSRIALRWYLTGLTEGDTGILDFGVGKPLTAVKGKYGCYFERTGYTPLRLNEIYAVRYNGYLYQFSPLSWAYRVINADLFSIADNTMANIIYEYWANAKAFYNAE